MTQKHFKHLDTYQYEVLAEMGLWHLLTDDQKAKIFLGSTRLPDAKQFKAEFTSFEQPTNYSDQPEN